MSKEIWKDVVGYESLYMVSNYGRVKSLWFNKEKILKQAIGKNGYLCVNLAKSGKQSVKNVHRLVAMAFIENQLNLGYVNHIDEIKTNNNVNNLEWCTFEYNVNYGNAKLRQAIKCSKTVIQYLKGKEIARFQSTMDVQRKLGFGNSTISSCCLGKRKTAYGYSWMYQEVTV